MSEAVKWRVMPWEWQRAPEWWIDKLVMYFQAQTELQPVFEERAKRRQQAG